ncbi:MptD family putative ECF transporter S component [Atopobium fossor]|uniref:MptD family putative ECF transporter S component n=1 Tax=Atopobium fossor TaxID=39487 RepID=UPI0004071E5C|nr:MptD family putative ECF transporter S component [Atopobium fossor]
MSLKNIITAAVFAVIGFIVMLGAGMAVTVFGTIGAFYLNVSFATILGAPIYVVLLKKVPAHGVAGIFYLVPGIVYLLMGLAPMTVVYIGAAILSELILLGEGIHDNKRIGISFIVSTLFESLHGMFFVLYYGAAGLVNQFPAMFTAELAQITANFYFNPLNVLIVIAIQIVASLLGVALAFFIDTKYFSGKRLQSALDEQVPSE